MSVRGGFTLQPQERICTHHLRARRRDSIAEFLLRNNCRQFGVLAHVGKSLLRETWVKRHISRAALQHSQHAHEHFQRTLTLNSNALPQTRS